MLGVWALSSGASVKSQSIQDINVRRVKFYEQRQPTYPGFSPESITYSYLRSMDSLVTYLYSHILDIVIVYVSPVFMNIFEIY